MINKIENLTRKSNVLSSQDTKDLVVYKQELEKSVKNLTENYLKVISKLNDDFKQVDPVEYSDEGEVDYYEDDFERI